MKGHVVYIGLGSNLGDRVAYLRDAVQRLSAMIRVERVSQLYVAAPPGYVRDGAYITAALKATTMITPSELLALLQSSELLRRRPPGGTFGPRPIGPERR